METSLTGLRRLLAVELPLDGVGPSQRDAVRRALRAGDAARDLVMISQDRLVVYLGKDKP